MTKSRRSIIERAEEFIPAEIRMISGCKDTQTSADVGNAGAAFGIPDQKGIAGGACTTAFLKVMTAINSSNTLTFKEVLLQMREILGEIGFSQRPQLTSSRALNVDAKFDVTPDSFSGSKRAVIVGINYVGQNGELNGCINDAINIKEYLMESHGFAEENIKLLLDDGNHTTPTRANMLRAYEEIVRESVPGDVVFLHYSGHGSYQTDTSGDEADKQDETLVPLDYLSEGDISDDELYETLVLPMKRGVFVTSIMDCCHSGTALDLPFHYRPSTSPGNDIDEEEDDDFDFEAPLRLSQVYITAALVNPEGRDADNEWVSIANYTAKKVRLRGWTLVDQNENEVATLKGTLESGSSIRVDDLMKRLRNKGGKLILKNRNGRVLDTKEWNGTTAGIPNVFPIDGKATSTSSQIVIGSALINPEGKDSGKEWIAIANYAATTIDLKTFSLSDQAGKEVAVLDGLVEPGHSIRIDNLTRRLRNKGGSLTLKNNDDVVVDSKAWAETREGIPTVFVENDRGERPSSTAQ